MAFEVTQTDDSNFPGLATAPEEKVEPAIQQDAPAEVVTPVGEPKENSDPKPEAEEPKSSIPEPKVDAEQLQFAYGDVQVKVEIPEDISAAFSEKELDAKAITAELYTSKDFSLTNETKEKLYGAFGKTLVDTYLSALKQNNDHIVSDFKAKHESTQKAQADAVKWGEDKSQELFGVDYAKLEERALATLDDSQLAQFNAAMESGSRWLQEAAFTALKQHLDAAAEGTVAPDIELGGKAATGQEEGPLSQADYIRQIAQIGRTLRSKPADYKAAMDKLDVRRRAGMAAGI